MLKYSVGLDVSAKTIYVCISVIDAAQKVTVKASCKVDNTPGGFKQLASWISKHHKQKDIPLVVVMEATGVYHESCSLYLYKEGFSLSIILPNKAKKWMQAEGLKSKNDKIDAQGLSKMGAEKCLELWQPAAEYYYQLRSLTRQHQSLQEHKTIVRNQLHAVEHGMYQNELVVEQFNTHIALLEAQIDALTSFIEQHLASDTLVAQKVAGICKIKGVGIMTVAVLLAETNGFYLFKNAPQLVSYAGYDVVENQSGNHNGKTRISKKGNGHIRRILHMPAFSVIQSKEKVFVDLFERTLKKHNIKMKSYVAVQKKILITIYALWKNNDAYDNNHINIHTKEREQVLPLGSTSVEVGPGNEVRVKVAHNKRATQGKHTIE